jgi:acyl carrier protein
MSADKFKTGLAEILGVKEGNVTDTLQLGDNNWDSAEHLAVIALIDESFGVTLPARDLTACASVKDLMNLIDRQISEKGTGA